MITYGRGVKLNGSLDEKNLKTGDNAAENAVKDTELTAKRKKPSSTIIVATLGVILFDVLAVAFSIWSATSGWAEPQYTLMIVFINFAYHFTYRVLIGYLVSWSSRKINVESKIFRISEKEKKLLEKTGIKKWKDVAPAWNRSGFVLSLADIKSTDKLKTALRGNISAEIIHQINFYLSFCTCFLAFVPALQSNWYVFLITSAVAAILADMPFIWIQRYNRFRLYFLYDKSKKTLAA